MIGGGCVFTGAATPFCRLALKSFFFGFCSGRRRAEAPKISVPTYVGHPYGWYWAPLVLCVSSFKMTVICLRARNESYMSSQNDSFTFSYSGKWELYVFSERELYVCSFGKGRKREFCVCSLKVRAICLLVNKYKKKGSLRLLDRMGAICRPIRARAICLLISIDSIV